MNLLYCPRCNRYLKSGSVHFIYCHCGWKQLNNINDNKEFQEIIDRCNQLEQENKSLTRFIWNVQNVGDGYLQYKEDLKHRPANNAEFWCNYGAFPEGYTRYNEH